MAELPLEGVGARLRRGRDAAGMSRADVAAVTRIPERQLIALEDGNYAALPARTYATGFARSYARAVGLDEEVIVAAVRVELHGAPARVERPVPATFELGDPARVPSRRLAWIALAAVLVLVAAIAVWRTLSQPSGGLPSILPADTPAAAATAAPAVATTPAPSANGVVVFTAQAPDVWVRFYDATGKDLLQKHMSEGETFTLPADAADPRLRTGRPDALAITIDGQSVPKLAEKQSLIDGVPVSAKALLARAAPTAASPVSAQPVRVHAAVASRPRPRATPSAAPSAAPTPATPTPTVVNPSTATQ